MTVAQSYIVDMLLWMLIGSSLLYDRPWRRDRAAPPNDPLFEYAWLVIEILLTLGLIVVVVGYVIVLLAVWVTPDGQRPAPTWHYLELALVVAWIVILGVGAFRRWVRHPPV